MNILITGGAGFIGTNTVNYFANDSSNKITVVDNLSRIGVSKNAEYLDTQFKNVFIIKANVQDVSAYTNELRKADVVIHLAGQTAVTTSVSNPQLDFESNLIGSFALLDSVRKENPDAIILYSSTNKVYGDLEHHKIVLNKEKEQYENLDYPIGIAEDQNLKFISPYGCSKGAMDAYMEDFARTYGLKTVVFRQSCIYGPFQMGVEDQGWVAHFSKQFLTGQPITIYGDGYQVRDLLYIEDLIQAYVLAIENIEKVRGQSFNIGGGISNAFSLRHVIRILAEKTGREIPVSFDETRSGDQRYFVSANTKLANTLGWKAKTSFDVGIQALLDWQKIYLKI